MHIIVVGAGVIGSALAYRLAQAGARPTVLDAAAWPGAGTSGRSFAWTNANNKPPRAYHDLNVAGMRAHLALRDELGATPWLHPGGSLEWYADEAAHAAQRAKVDRLRAWGYRAEWVTASEARELEPDLDPAALAEAPIAYFPDEGWLDPVPYVHAMLDAAQRHGARLRTAARVEQVHLAGGRVAGVSLEGGERLGADVVVNCAGRWAAGIQVDGAPVPPVPLAPTRGLLVLTPPVATCLGRVVRSPSVHVRPDGAGRLMLHFDDADADISEETPASPELPIAQTLVRRAAELLPSIGHDVRPEAVRIGVRPIPADGLSAVGPLPGTDGYYVVVTHSGVTLSPHLAALAAREIAHGAHEPTLEPFRLTRLFAPAAVGGPGR